jgi:phytoene/squalene synthetase
MNVQSPDLGAGALPAANRAGGSSFYLAMRILGREKRAAMFEIYSFCREVDDIADEDRPRGVETTSR